MTPVDTLAVLRAAEVLSPLDLHFARAMARLCPSAPEAVLLGAAFASRAVAHGHVCADLRRILDRPLVDAAGHEVPGIVLPHKFEWVMALGDSPLCRNGPLVFDGEARLYLRRYWEYEQRVAAGLRLRASASEPVNLALLRTGVTRLFAAGEGRAADPDQQRAAVGTALRRLSVISGGPGTGKTTTVLRVLALLVEQALAADRPAPRIELVAPTGKAAARLAESINAGREHLPAPAEIKDAIPREAATIHRRLGTRPGHATRFRHDRDNPLPADIVLVDEASMVDLALLAKLLDAVPEHARLILLGDKDQLASVDAGAILGDICNTGGELHVSQAFARDLAAVLGPEATAGLHVGTAEPGLGDCVHTLRRSFRFQASGGIGRLAAAINAGDGSAVEDVLHAGHPEVRVVDPGALGRAIGGAMVKAFRPVLAATDPLVRLQRLGAFRLLAAHRHGPFGTEAANELAVRHLAAAGLVPARDRTHGDLWYDGRPIVITQNDYQLELWNGDVGILHRFGDDGLHACFLDRDGLVRKVAPARLPPHESVYAMTVHKSQGSEFDEVWVLMPPELSPILTRELLYTAITRARDRVTLYASTDVVREAVTRRIDRASGLRDALFGP